MDESVKKARARILSFSATRASVQATRSLRRLGKALKWDAGFVTREQRLALQYLVSTVT